MTEIIVSIAVSIISIGVMIWIAVTSNKIFKYIIPIIKEVLDEQKKNQ